MTSSNLIMTIQKGFLTIVLTPSVENFLITAIITCITLLYLKFMRQSHSKNLPPLPDIGMLEMIKILIDGKGAPDYYLSTMKKKGLLYRLPLPEMSHWIVVCDPALARRIMIEEEEKPALSSRYNGITNGVPNVAVTPTHGHSWQSARKGMAPSFNMTNICLSLPEMYEKIDDLKKVLAQHESEETSVNLPELMTQLTLDFICAGKSSKEFCLTNIQPTSNNQFYNSESYSFCSYVRYRLQNYAVTYISWSFHYGRA